jgi:DNA repair protein RecN (Recombination protein N)
MLTSIEIEHFILIKQQVIHLQKGLSVITGATGSGKSMLMKAIAFVFGEKPSGQCILPGETSATVTLRFQITSPLVRTQLEQTGHAVADQTLVISRKINDKNKSNLWLNQRPTTLKDVKALQPILLCWQKQHAQLICQDQTWQQRFIDSHLTCDALQTYQGAFQATQKQLKHLANLTNSILSDNHYQDLLANINDLAQLPAESEEDIIALFEQHKAQSHQQKHTQALTKSAQALEQNTQIYKNLGSLIDDLQLHPAHDELSQTFNQLQSLHDDLDYQLNKAISDSDQNSFDAEQIKKYISLANDLSRKFNTLPEQLPILLKQLTDKKQAHDDAIDSLSNTRETLKILQQKQTASANNLTQLREKIGQEIGQIITDQLQTIGLKGGRFSVQISPLQQMNESGQDAISFLASMNPELPPCPLKFALSGGELTRVALLLNLQQHNEQTLLLDEVDTGVSGEVASQIGKLLRKICAETTALCITHTPQVAATGDWHLDVSKTHIAEKTHIEIKTLTQDARAHAIAKLISGEKVEKSALEHAEKLFASD